MERIILSERLQIRHFEEKRSCGSGQLIPLPGGIDPSIPVEVRLRLGKPTVSESHPELMLPTVFAPVLKTEWNPGRVTPLFRKYNDYISFRFYDSQRSKVPLRGAPVTVRDREGRLVEVTLRTDFVVERRVVPKVYAADFMKSADARLAGAISPANISRMLQVATACPCRSVHVRLGTKPPRMLRLCISGRPAEHCFDAPPRQLAAA